MLNENHFWIGLMLFTMLLMFTLPVMGLMLLFLVSGTATLYYGAITSGIVKEPLLDYFRQYGHSPPLHPLVRLLVAGGVFSFGLSFVAPALFGTGFFANLLPSVAFVVLAGMLEASAVLIFHQKTLRSSLPLWYAQLMRETSRQERRHIGWAWLRLPRRMRWRMNGDQRAFHTWADLVRLTVIYGAYDPNSPWHKWT